MDSIFLAIIFSLTIFLVLFFLWRKMFIHYQRDFALFNLVFANTKPFNADEIVSQVRKNNLNLSKPYIYQSKKDITRQLDIWVSKGLLVKNQDKYFFKEG